MVLKFNLLLSLQLKIHPFSQALTVSYLSQRIFLRVIGAAAKTFLADSKFRGFYPIGKFNTNKLRIRSQLQYFAATTMKFR